MKRLLITLTLLLQACSGQSSLPYPALEGGKVLDRMDYLCEFGVLYSRDWNDGLHAMIDRQGVPVRCSQIMLTRDEWEARYK